MKTNPAEKSAVSGADSTIHHVSDTALWAAHYRAVESENPQPLFHDPLAKILTGRRGQNIAESMGAMARYTQWNVVLRTHVIDQLIQRLVAQGVDTVINLGAGLDTRPYRMSLPATLRWIEVDHPRIIEHKQDLLKTEPLKVQLDRVGLDLADPLRRQKLFQELGHAARKALILTEGVIPYLTEDQVGALAEDLRQQSRFHFWIAEYLSKDGYRYLQDKGRGNPLKNAPFQFFPEDWLGFFESRGWKPAEIRYLGEESQVVGRPAPAPWWAALIVPFLSEDTRKKFLRQMGYVVFENGAR